LQQYIETLRGRRMQKTNSGDLDWLLSERRKRRCKEPAGQNHECPSIHY
jgi:hypothetical protein